jgi:hypothetical protein
MVSTCFTNDETTVAISQFSEHQLRDVLNQSALSLVSLYGHLVELETVLSLIRHNLREGEEVLKEERTQYTCTWWSFLGGSYKRLRLVEDYLENIRYADTHSRILARDVASAKDELTRLLKELEALDGYFQDLPFGDILPIDIVADSYSEKLLELLDTVNRLHPHP